MCIRHGGVWYVNEPSLAKYLAKQKREQEEQRRQQSEERKRELATLADAVEQPQQSHASTSTPVTVTPHPVLRADTQTSARRTKRNAAFTTIASITLLLAI